MSGRWSSVRRTSALLVLLLLLIATAPQFALADASPAPAPAATAQTLANVLDALYTSLDASIPSTIKQKAVDTCKENVHLQAFRYQSGPNNDPVQVLASMTPEQCPHYVALASYLQLPRQLLLPADEVLVVKQGQAQSAQPASNIEITNVQAARLIAQALAVAGVQPPYERPAKLSQVYDQFVAARYCQNIDMDRDCRDSVFATMVAMRYGFLDPAKAVDYDAPLDASVQSRYNTHVTIYINDGYAGTNIQDQLGKLLNQPLPIARNQLKDTIPSWADPYVTHVIQRELMRGTGDFRFSGDQPATLLQYYIVLGRMLNRAELLPAALRDEAVKQAIDVCQNGGSLTMASMNLNEVQLDSISQGDPVQCVQVMATDYIINQRKDVLASMQKYKRMDAPVTRGTAARLTAAVLLSVNEKLGNNPLPHNDHTFEEFSDLKGITDTGAIVALDTVIQHSIFQGYAGQIFRPLSTMNRYELAVIATRLDNLLNGIPNDDVWQYVAPEAADAPVPAQPKRIIAPLEEFFLADGQFSYKDITVTGTGRVELAKADADYVLKLMPAKEKQFTVQFNGLAMKVGEQSSIRNGWMQVGDASAQWQGLDVRLKGAALGMDNGNVIITVGQDDSATVSKDDRPHLVVPEGMTLVLRQQLQDPPIRDVELYKTLTGFALRVSGGTGELSVEGVAVKVAGGVLTIPPAFEGINNPVIERLWGVDGSGIRADVKMRQGVVAPVSPNALDIIMSSDQQSVWERMRNIFKTDSRTDSIALINTWVRYLLDKTQGVSVRAGDTTPTGSLHLSILAGASKIQGTTPATPDPVVDVNGIAGKVKENLLAFLPKLAEPTVTPTDHSSLTITLKKGTDANDLSDDEAMPAAQAIYEGLISKLPKAQLPDGMVDKGKMDDFVQQHTGEKDPVKITITYANGQKAYAEYLQALLLMPQFKEAFEVTSTRYDGDPPAMTDGSDKKAVLSIQVTPVNSNSDLGQFITPHVTAQAVTVDVAATDASARLSAADDTIIGATFLGILDYYGLLDKGGQ